MHSLETIKKINGEYPEESGPWRKERDYTSAFIKNLEAAAGVKSIHEGRTESLSTIVLDLREKAEKWDANGEYPEESGPGVKSIHEGRTEFLSTIVLMHGGRESFLFLLDLREKAEKWDAHVRELRAEPLRKNQ